MAFREYLGLGSDDREKLTCDWCGKEGISTLWSGSKVKYCSFRCSAAGSYPRNIILAICAIALQSILVLMQIIMFSKNPTVSPIHPVLIIPQVFITLIVLSFVYSVYIGRSMRKEKNGEYTFEDGKL